MVAVPNGVKDYAPPRQMNPQDKIEETVTDFQDCEDGGFDPYACASPENNQDPSWGLDGTVLTAQVIIPVGSSISKLFDLGMFTGTVKSYDLQAKLYHVVYDDGDEEEFDFDGLAPLVVTNTASGLKRKDEAVEEGGQLREKKRQHLTAVEEKLNEVKQTRRTFQVVFLSPLSWPLTPTSSFIFSLSHRRKYLTRGLESTLNNGSRVPGNDKKIWSCKKRTYSENWMES